MLNIAQLLLPDTRQLTTLKQLFADEVDKLYTCWCGNQALAFALDVVTLEQSLDDTSAT